MYVIQLLLPLYDNRDQPQPRELFEDVRRELVDRFGGLTAYTRAPANGLWQEDETHTVRDELVVYEVMTEVLNQDWWAGYRRQLEACFEQQTLVVRAQSVIPL